MNLCCWCLAFNPSVSSVICYIWLLEHVCQCHLAHSHSSNISTHFIVTLLGKTYAAQRQQATPEAIAWGLKESFKTHWSRDSDNAVQMWETRKHISLIDRPVWAKHSESLLFFNLQFMPFPNLMIKAKKTTMFCKLWRLLIWVTVGKRLWHPYPFQPVQVQGRPFSPCLQGYGLP